MTHRITVFIPKNSTPPKNSNGQKMDLKDMLGPELEKYYDGWEHGPDGSSYLFYDVPQNIMNLAKNNADNYKNILKLTIS